MQKQNITWVLCGHFVSHFKASVFASEALKIPDRVLCLQSYRTFLFSDILYQTQADAVLFAKVIFALVNDTVGKLHPRCV